MSATIYLTVDIDSVSFEEGTPLARVAELWRALLADGVVADLRTEMDDGDFHLDPSSLN